MSDETKSKPTIKALENGPLQVKGLDRMVNSRGQTVKTRDGMALCRCGHAKTKPFCDGSHRTAGFLSQKEEDRVPDERDIYSAPKVSIHDNRGICSHAGFCTAGLPDVFRMGVEPWIDPEGAPPEDIIGTIRKCPSGALSYEVGGKVHTVYQDTPKIYIARNGPYYVRGLVELLGVEKGKGASGEHYTLCRCGASKNKPFCDGTHWYAGFRDDEGLTIAQAARAEEKSQEKWAEIGKADDYASDTIHTAEVGRKQVVFVRKDDAWYALNGQCPHQGGPLNDGDLTEDGIRCPWHGYEFKLKDGKGVGNDHGAEVLEIKVENGILYISAPEPRHSAWTVSHVIAETMVEWGVDTVFGMVGHSNLGMAEAIRVQEQRGAMRYFGIRHEGAASFACSGYAKITGRPAACLSIAGPGATNLLTGLWDARVDRAPVLALTGQVKTQFWGPGAFQEIDLPSAFAAVSRFSQTMLRDSDHAGLTAEALKNAIVQRDVAHLILPDEIQTIDAGQEGPSRPEGRISETPITPPAQSIDYASYRIARARRPAIIVGYGARDHMNEVIPLAESLNCPVLTTFKAKGQIPDHHPLAAGVLGRSGIPVSAWAMNQADLLVVFGASFSQHTGIARNKPVIQVDYERMALGKFHPVTEPVWGDIGMTARLLRAKIGDGHGGVDQRGALAEQWKQWRAEKSERAKQDNGKGLNSAILFQVLSDVVPEDAVISVDVGNNTYSFGRYFESRHHRVIMSGYLGSIGFGFPAAMGAWAAVDGERKVVSVSGDGGFGQYMGEFMTAVKYGMNITHILLNNDELGKISKEQRDGEWPVWQTGLHNLSFAEYARQCGGFGVRVEKAGQLRGAFEAALQAEGPSLVEVMTDPLLS